MATAKEIRSVLATYKLRSFDPGVLPGNCKAVFDTYVNGGVQLYEQFAGSVLNRECPIVRLCVSNSLSTNAFVLPLPAKNSFMVCLSYGLIANLFTCCKALLAHPAVLPQIGDPENTECTFQCAKNGLTDFTYDNRLIRENIPVSKGFPVLNYPLDEDRALYSRLLCDISVQYCLCHEWGHISGGHLQYLKTGFNVHEIMEIDGIGNRPRLGKIKGLGLRKVMEFDADLTASSLLLSVPGKLHSENKTAFHSYPASFIAKYDMRDAVYFSLLMLYHLFQEVRVVNQSGWSSGYPIPYYRFLAMLHAISTSIDSDEKEIWQNHEFTGAVDFLRASIELNLAPKMGFTFLAHIYNENATKRAMVKLAKSAALLQNNLSNYRF